MLIFLLSTLALVGAQHNHFDEHYNFGHLHQPIDRILVFDCGSNPNRAIKNPKFTFRSTDPNADPNHLSLELPGSIIIEDFEIEVTKPIVRPFNGRVEAWRTIWLLGGAGSTFQLGCFGLTTDYVGIDGFGTCDYGDLCGILDLNTPINDTTGQPTCFEEAINFGIPEDQCTCEGIIAPKVYATQGYNRLIDFTDLEPGILTFLAEGDYEIKLIAENDRGEEEACIGIRLPVKEYVDPNYTGGGWLFGTQVEDVVDVNDVINPSEIGTDGFMTSSPSPSTSSTSSMTSMANDVIMQVADVINPVINPSVIGTDFMTSSQDS